MNNYRLPRSTGLIGSIRDRWEMCDQIKFKWSLASLTLLALFLASCVVVGGYWEEGSKRKNKTLERQLRSHLDQLAKLNWQTTKWTTQERYVLIAITTDSLDFPVMVKVYLDDTSNRFLGLSPKQKFRLVYKDPNRIYFKELDSPYSQPYKNWEQDLAYHLGNLMEPQTTSPPD